MLRVCFELSSSSVRDMGTPLRQQSRRSPGPACPTALSKCCQWKLPEAVNPDVRAKQHHLLWEPLKMGPHKDVRKIFSQFLSNFWQVLNDWTSLSFGCLVWRCCLSFEGFNASLARVSPHSTHWALGSDSLPPFTKPNLIKSGMCARKTFAFENGVASLSSSFVRFQKLFHMAIQKSADGFFCCCLLERVQQVNDDSLSPSGGKLHCVPRGLQEQNWRVFVDQKRGLVSRYLELLT